MAEINFNNLYNQFTPMEQDQYDGVFGSSGFKDKYAQNPDSPLVTQNSNYEKLKAVADAEAQVPETSMFGGMMDTLNPFSKLSAAEPDIYNSVPSYTPNNLPFTSMSDMYNLSQRDLVDQINMGPRSITPPMTMDQMMYGSVLSNNIASPRTVLNQQTGIMQKAPTQNFEFLSSAYEDENEDDQQVDYLPGQPKSFKDSATLQEYFQNRNPLKGVGGLLGLITGNPIFGLISGGARGLGALNNKMQNSDFGRSKTLMDYLDAKKYGGIDARDRAAQQNMREARAIQTQVDRRGDSTSRVADRNRSSVTTSSAAKSKGVGGGGYTKSDSNRESYRG